MPKYGDLEEVNLYYPESLVKNSARETGVRGEYASLSYKPNYLNNRGFMSFDTAGKDYAKVQISTREDRNTSAAFSRLPRTLRAMSKPVTIDFRAQNDYNERGIGQLKSPALLSLNLKSDKVNGSGYAHKIYYYNLNTKKWSRVGAWYSNGGTKINARISSPGYYVIVKNR